MNKKTVIIILSVMILGLSIGYAALSSSLNITGSAKLGATADSWNIHFENAKCEKDGYGKAGNIEIKNKTSLEISGVEFNAPGDMVLCTFDIVNDGTIDAKVTSITHPDKNKFTYTGSGSNKTTDEEIVKNGISTTIDNLQGLMYYDGKSEPTEIKLGDELKSGETKGAVVFILLDEAMTKLPTNEVTVSNIFGQIIYGQYKVGDKNITRDLIPVKVGDAVYYNPVSNEMDCTNYTETNSKNENKTGCMKWYVIANNDETMNLLLDHNTTYKVAWNDGTTASGTSNEKDEIIARQVEDTTNTPVTANAKLASDVSGWSSQAKSTARMITADEIWNITSSTNGVPNWSSTDVSDGFLFNGNTSNDQRYAWLFNNIYDCEYYGCNINDYRTYGYWTSSYAPNGYGIASSNKPSNKSEVQKMDNGIRKIANNSLAWYVSRYGRLSASNVDNADSLGLRPVITISKS